MDTQADDASLSDEKRGELLIERERALITALTQAGIKVSEGEQLDLEPQVMRLKARTSAARIAEVNELLRKEPPRRTVTGSFRMH